MMPLALPKRILIAIAIEDYAIAISRQMPIFISFLAHFQLTASWPWPHY